MYKRQPYLVYAHEWVQKLDGTVEAIQLTEDLSGGVGNPFLMFRATSAPWYEWDGLMYDQYGARYGTVEELSLIHIFFPSVKIFRSATAWRI